MKIEEARARLFRSHPYFASVIWALSITVDERVPTLGVDFKGRLVYNPKYMGGLKNEEGEAVLAHECLHIVMRHDVRAKAIGVPDEDKAIWNIAGDCEINDILIDDGVGKHLPGSCFLPATIGAEKGKSAEHYYQILRQQKEEAKQAGKPEPQPGNGPGQGNCGSCAGGHKHDDEGQSNGDSGNDPGQGNGNGQDGMSPIERELICKQFAEAVASTVQSKGQGSVPAGIQRLANNILTPPKIPWGQKLRRYIRDSAERRSGYDEVSYARPRRSQWGLWRDGIGPILPSPFSPGISAFCVVDTSGSMSQDQLRKALSEITGICNAIGTPLATITVDSSVGGNIQKATSGKDIRLIGGGGTDMTVGIMFAYKQKPKPAVCIVLTDGYTPWPEYKLSGMEVIACVIGGDVAVPAHIIRVLVD